MSSQKGCTVQKALCAPSGQCAIGHARRLGPSRRHSVSRRNRAIEHKCMQACRLEPPPTQLDPKWACACVSHAACAQRRCVPARRASGDRRCLLQTRDACTQPGAAKPLRALRRGHRRWQSVDCPPRQVGCQDGSTWRGGAAAHHRLFRGRQPLSLEPPTALLEPAASPCALRASPGQSCALELRKKEGHLRGVA